jgi:hypothetical protein
MCSVQSVTHVLGLYRSRASSPEAPLSSSAVSRVVVLVRLVGEQAAIHLVRDTSAEQPQRFGARITFAHAPLDVRRAQPCVAALCQGDAMQ